MPSRKFPLATLIAASTVLIASQALAQSNAMPPAAKTVRLVTTVPFPEKGGFADYLAVEPTLKTLYVGYTSKNTLVEIDTQTNRVKATIKDLPRVHTVAVVPSLNLGFTSNGGENKVGVLDLATHRVLQRIPVGVGPDAIIDDPAAHVVYVGNHKGKTASIIDPDHRKVLAQIPLGGAPEYPQADPETGLVYQNLEDTSELVVVDPKRHSVRARYSLAPGEGPSGLALDEKNHRLFSACDNETLVVMDAETGKRVATLPIGKGVDFAAYDPTLRRIYTANGDSATMTVIQQDTADRYHVIENVPTFPRAHALAVDPSTHRIYVVHGDAVTVYDSVR